jgi:hypothetical protein
MAAPRARAFAVRTRGVLAAGIGVNLNASIDVNGNVSVNVGTERAGVRRPRSGSSRHALEPP